MMPPVPQNRTWKPMRGYTMATSAGNSFTLQTLHLRPQARSINCWNDEAVPRSKGQQTTSTFDAVQNALESRMLRLWPPQVRAGLGNEVGQDLNKAQPRKMQRRNNMTHNRAIQSKCSSHGSSSSCGQMLVVLLSPTLMMVVQMPIKQLMASPDST